MVAGLIVAMGPVEEVFEEYYTIIHGAPRQRVVATEPASEGVDGAQDGVDGAVKEEKITSIGTKEEVIREYLKQAPAQETQDEAVWHLPSFTADPRAPHECCATANNRAHSTAPNIDTPLPT